MSLQLQCNSYHLHVLTKSDIEICSGFYYYIAPTGLLYQGQNTEFPNVYNSVNYSSLQMKTPLDVPI